MSHDDPRDDAPRDDAERRDAERLRRFLDAEGGAPPPAEDAEVVGLFAEATGGVELPEGAWARIAAPRVGETAAQPRRAVWRPVLALAAAAVIAVGAVTLWPGGSAPLPGASVAEVDALGRALSDTTLSPRARLAALAEVNDGRRGRLLGGGPVGAR